MIYEKTIQLDTNQKKMLNNLSSASQNPDIATEELTTVITSHQFDEDMSVAVCATMFPFNPKGKNKIMYQALLLFDGEIILGETSMCFDIYREFNIPNAGNQYIITIE